jgi:predicted transcriptional regulator
LPETEKKGRRVRHDIVSEILQTAIRGARKTYLAQKCGLNYAQFIKYLDALHTVNLIREESGVWYTTESGRHVIEACRICQTLMNQIP